MDFSPNSKIRQCLNQEFLQDKYQNFRNWYFKNHDDKRLADIKTKYYTYLNKKQCILSFIKWYYDFLLKSEFYTESQLNVLTGIQKD